VHFFIARSHYLEAFRRVFPTLSRRDERSINCTMRRKNHILLSTLVAPLILIGGVTYLYRSPLRDYMVGLTKPELPAERASDEFTADESAASQPKTPQQLAPELDPTRDAETPQDSPDADPLPEVVTPPNLSPTAINLAVPFTSQAPTSNWNLPFQEACEEASIIMVNAYYKGRTLLPAETEDEINSLVDWQNKEFGSYLDTTAEQTATMLRSYFGYEHVEVSYEVTAETITAELKAGRPVIIPAAGRQLGNPYFTSPGPLYHMIVIKGVAENGDFITNDPGTRRGHNYTYKPEKLLSAVHDWNDGEVETGRRAMIVVYPPTAPR